MVHAEKQVPRCARDDNLVSAIRRFELLLPQPLSLAPVRKVN